MVLCMGYDCVDICVILYVECIRGFVFDGDVKDCYKSDEWVNGVWCSQQIYYGGEYNQ